jgi:serine/threonine protein phosphatase PrpC
MLALQIAILSERGGRAYNEDACGHWHSERQLCCVVADGAGGHGGGETASRLAVTQLLQNFAAHPSAGGDDLQGLVRATNQAVREGRVPDTALAQMYSTVVCLVIDFADYQAHWAHAGDSRLYWFRDGRVIRQTRDHSVVQSMVDAGVISQAETRTHPNRSELRSALGAEDRDLEVSDSGMAHGVQPGDVFLLCSDGVWEHVTEDVLEALLAAAASPDDWLGAIEQAIRAATQNRRSHDNFTALTVWAASAPAAG